MQISQPDYQKYLFVCENKREAGACCAEAGGRLRESLKAKVKEKNLEKKIRVSRTGCLDACSEGPNVLLMPDNVWFKKVSAADLDEIVSRVSASFEG